MEACSCVYLRVGTTLSTRIFARNVEHTSTWLLCAENPRSARAELLIELLAELLAELLVFCGPRGDELQVGVVIKQAAMSGRRIDTLAISIHN